MILQCPRCGNIIEWEREDKPEGPGKCHCNPRLPWNVLKARPKIEPGFVVVYSSKGKQRLFGPGFQEQPDAWVPEKA